MAFRLFTTAYRTTNPGRREELDKALRSNIGAFDSVHVVAEANFCPDWLRTHDAEWWIQHRRQTVADLIEFAQGASQADIVVLANSDIEFTWPDLLAIERSLEAHDAYCLSRWDLVAGKGCILFDSWSSQDSWVFRGPPRPAIGGDYAFGLPGTDNKLAHQIQSAGYRVLNPAKSIRSYHTHVSGERLSNKPELRLPLPYLWVKPHLLGAVPEYRVPWKLSRRAGSFQV